MLIGIKAGVQIHCTCDRCKKEFIYMIPLLEIDSFVDFRSNVVDTMNAEGWAIRGDWWSCPICAEGK